MNAALRLENVVPADPSSGIIRPPRLFRMEPMFTDVTAQIIADHVLHNVAALRRKLAPGVRLCAPLKADAYGHGVRIVAPLLESAGVDCAAVAQLDEAIELRRCGWSRPILVLGNVLAVANIADRRDRLAAVIDHDLTLTLADEHHLAEIAAAARSAGVTIDLHIKLDTGMGRMGFVATQAAIALEALLAHRGVRLAGVYSHFGTADLSDADLTDRQIAAFRSFLATHARHIGPGVLRHFANTAATIERPDTHFDMVRPGIGLYGCLPAERMSGLIDLRPAMRVVSHVSLIKELPEGHCVGYGCTYRTTRPTRIGIVPVGYHDGYLRALSNRARVGLPTGDAPVIGRVSMDQLAIDMTHLPTTIAGDVVVLIDERTERPNSAENIARLLGTICYEVLCLVGPRVRRVLVPSATGPNSEPYEVRDEDSLNQPHKFGRWKRQERLTDSARAETPALHGDTHETINAAGQV